MRLVRTQHNRASEVCIPAVFDIASNEAEILDVEHHGRHKELPCCALFASPLCNVGTYPSCVAAFWLEPCEPSTWPLAPV